MKKINKNILFAVILIGIFLPVVYAIAAVPDKLTTALTGIKDVFIAVGVALVVVGFIVAGILYLTSAGSPEKTGTAKKALIAAAIGGAIVVLAKGTDVLINIITGTLGV